MKEGLKLKGILEEINPFTKTSTGKPVCKVKINNLTFNWWEIPSAKEFAEKNPVGKEVVCIYTEKPNPQNENYPFKNINSLGFPEDFEEKDFEGINQEEVVDDGVGKSFESRTAEGTTYWKSKSLFLEKVTGFDIVERQNDINNTENKFVVATQQFKRKTLLQSERNDVAVDLTDDDGNVLYDAFIYYKER